jgi:Uma2 family endonuclease
MVGPTIRIAGERNVVLQSVPGSTSAEGSAVVVRVRPILQLTDDQLYALCRLNRELRIERTAQGGLSIMPPAGGDSSALNAEVAIQLGVWAKRDGTGRTFDSSGGFVLPNGAVRSPDASWVSHARLASLTAEQRKKFLPLCADFVVELRSRTDSLAVLQDKMREYMDSGARLGWLIDPLGDQVFVYRPDSPVEHLQRPDRVSADPLLPGFRLEMDELRKAVRLHAG